MDQQVAPTLWLPPGMCVLNTLPTMNLCPPIPSPQSTAQLLKHPVVTVATHNFLPNTHLLHQPQVISSPQSFIHIPIDNLVLPSPSTDQQSYELPASVFEVPQQNPHYQSGHQISPTTVAANIPVEPSHQRHINGITKVLKKRRISPSAKRRSRLRLIAFLEQKRKQQDEISLPMQDGKAISSHDADESYSNESQTSPS